MAPFHFLAEVKQFIKYMFLTLISKLFYVVLSSHILTALILAVLLLVVAGLFLHFQCGFLSHCHYCCFGCFYCCLWYTCFMLDTIFFFPFFSFFSTSRLIFSTALCASGSLFSIFSSISYVKPPLPLTPCNVTYIEG